MVLFLYKRYINTNIRIPEFDIIYCQYDKGMSATEFPLSAYPSVIKQYLESIKQRRKVVFIIKCTFTQIFSIV